MQEVAPAPLPEPDHRARGSIVLVGTGAQPYREYALASLAERYELCAVLASPPTWQRPYLTQWRVADLADPAAVARAVAAMTAAGPEFGLLTWDETVLEVTAQAAEILDRPHMSAQAAANCRDKYRTRSLLDAAGLPAVRHLLTSEATAAEQAAACLGYPVVLKPRALAGSMGVTLARDVQGVRRAFALAVGAAYATLPSGHGVLVEEYLDGPEVSVDSAVTPEGVTCVHVARKRLGFAPHFEEVGHLVDPTAELPEAAALKQLVQQAHAVLGVQWGVTHAELRYTRGGWRLIELNGRLGGDLIPLVGQLATGIDLVVAAAELSLGRTPDLTPRQRRAAEVRFAYLPEDGVVQHIDLSAAAAVPHVQRTLVLAPVGSVLHLPPHDAIPRTAAVVVAAPDAARCATALDQAEGALDIRHEPLRANAVEGFHAAV